MKIKRGYKYPIVIPGKLALMAIAEHDRQQAIKAERREKIKSFFKRIGAYLCLR